MHTIAFEDGGKQEETVSAFLMLVLEFGTEIGVFGVCGLLDRLLHVAMKTVRYCPLYKAQTIIASIVMGCAHTKAINETLGAEVAAANYLGMHRFPDQSQINRYLSRFTAANVGELGAVHAHVLRQESRAARRRHRPMWTRRRWADLRVPSQGLLPAQAGPARVSTLAGLPQRLRGGGRAAPGPGEHAGARALARRGPGGGPPARARRDDRGHHLAPGRRL